MANGNGNKGLVMLAAILIPMAGLGAWIFSVGGGQKALELGIQKANEAVATVKREGTDVCRKSEITGVQIKGKVDNLAEKLAAVQADMQSLEDSVDSHMQAQYEMQRQLLDEIKKRNNGN